MFRRVLTTPEWVDVGAVLGITFVHWMLLCNPVCSYNAMNDEVTNVCLRQPSQPNLEQTPGDGGFKITIDSDAYLQHYVPERVYRISITGVLVDKSLVVSYLVAVSHNSSNESVTVGQFYVADSSQLVLRAACPHIVMTVDNLPKSAVDVLWLSPKLGTGCVEFRATVIENTNMWYKDDGHLTKVLCEDLADGDSIDAVDPFPHADCCVCGTAKYQLTFLSLWSRSTHTHNFPDVNTSRLYWSPVVGASHSKHYAMWQFNTLASRGISDICQYGDTRALEDEIRHQSSNVRTVIKTPGIRWTQEHGLQQQRWAHFSVDRKHHLLTVLSRLSPSPDWCVGVSALDLCLPNCSWVADTTVRLSAWDAGVRDGHSFTSEKRLTDPAQPIRHLTDRAANNNPSLPFRSGRPGEPIAVLRLHRFDPKPDEDHEVCSRVTADKAVINVEPTTPVIDHRHQHSCAMGSWSQWSPCSATCGTGTRTRTRAPVKMTGRCSQSVERVSEPCRSASCVARCQLYDWSAWSACTDGFVLCSADEIYIGSCSRRRFRSFRTARAEIFCNETVEEEEPCQPHDSEILSAFNTDIMSKCFSAADSGPCKGNFPRWYFDAAYGECRTFLYGGCRGNANRYTAEDDCMKACRTYNENIELRDPDDRVAHPTYIAENDVWTTAASRASIFPITAAPGTTSENITIEGNSQRGSGGVNCIMSAWSAWSRCSVSCGRKGVQTRSRTVMRPQSGNGRKCPRRKLRRRRCRMPACPTASDCRYSEWSLWSSCARSCGTDTVQERIQRVHGTLSQRSRCPVKLQRRLCTLPPCV